MVMKWQFWKSSDALPVAMPPAFRFPLDFTKWIEQGGTEELSWWNVLDTENRQAWLGILRDWYPSRSLVPFAKFVATDDVACFDGTDITGNPIVHYVHSFADSGWEDRGTVPSFHHWLEDARERERDEPFE